jgi:hypothetical protein
VRGSSYLKYKPAYDGSAQIGWQVDCIDPRSMFAFLGVKAGDILLTSLPLRTGTEASANFATMAARPPAPKEGRGVVPLPPYEYLHARHLGVPMVSFELVRDGDYVNVSAQVNGKVQAVGRASPLDCAVLWEGMSLSCEAVSRQRCVGGPAAGLGAGKCL